MTDGDESPNLFEILRQSPTLNSCMEKNAERALLLVGKTIVGLLNLGFGAMHADIRVNQRVFRVEILEIGNDDDG